jgi:acetylornithine deacetylase
VDAEILAAVAAEEDAMVRLLGELVRAPTLLGRESVGQAVMRRAFAALGLEPIEVGLDAAALERHPAGAPHSWDVEGKANVLATWEPGGPVDGRSLILNGHIDIVSPEPRSLWTREPYGGERDGDWVYGRGAGDMKAGLVAMIGAVAGLRRLGVTPRAPVQLQSVVEEECTGNGALACVLAGHRADAAILTEPTRLAIWNAQVGVLWFQVRVLGVPAHAGDARGGRQCDRSVLRGHRGAARAGGRAQRRQAAAVCRLPPPHQPQRRGHRRRRLAVDRRRRVPHEFRLACYPGERVDVLKNRVEATVASAATSHPVLSGYRVEVRYEGFRCDGYELAPDAPLITALRAACMRASGAEPPLYASTATTDARTFQLYGDTPAVCFGPVAENEHGVDERVSVASITAAAQAIALFIADWCGLASSG